MPDNMPVMYHATQEIKDFLHDTLPHPQTRVAAMKSHAHPNAALLNPPSQPPLDILPETPYYGNQRPGFFVFASKQAARYAIDPLRDESRYDSAKASPAAVIGVIPQAGQDWRPDYELHGVAVLKKMVETPVEGQDAGEFLQGRQTRLFGQTYTIRKATPRVVQVEITEGKHKSLKSVSPARDDETDYSIGDAGVVQAVCDIMERDAPEHFRKLNQDTIAMLLEKKTAALKYMGKEPLDIVSREAYMDGDWRAVEPQHLQAMAAARPATTRKGPAG